MSGDTLACTDAFMNGCHVGHQNAPNATPGKQAQRTRSMPQPPSSPAPPGPADPAVATAAASPAAAAVAASAAVPFTPRSSSRSAGPQSSSPSKLPGSGYDPAQGPPMSGSPRGNSGVTSHACPHMSWCLALSASLQHGWCHLRRRHRTNTHTSCSRHVPSTLCASRCRRVLWPAAARQGPLSCLSLSLVAERAVVDGLAPLERPLKALGEQVCGRQAGARACAVDAQANSAACTLAYAVF